MPKDKDESRIGIVTSSVEPAGGDGGMAEKEKRRFEAGRQESWRDVIWQRGLIGCLFGAWEYALLVFFGASALALCAGIIIVLTSDQRHDGDLNLLIGGLVGTLAFAGGMAAGRKGGRDE